MHLAPLLCRFRSIRPRYEWAQARSLEWLADLHTQSEVTARGGDAAKIRETIAKIIRRCACSPDQIAARGVEIPDGHERREFGDMLVYDVTRSPQGAGAGVRTEAYRRSVDAFFARAFDDDDRPPADLLHVTCTGYASPSGAQRLVASRGWGSVTRVLHAYHMGCYAAIPAVRMAAALLGAPPPSAARRVVDIAHTEICSLHGDPSSHTPEQIVVQSLFADGFIRYAASLDPADHANEPGLELLATHEALLPDSGESMQWISSEWGMRMVLGRDVPERVRTSLPGFVRELFARGGFDFARVREPSCFAAHPGGPRIIDAVRDALELTEAQVAISRGVLRRCGNMSSATLPHIWQAIVDAPGVDRGTLVPSLAFGPGLTVCGALFRKR